MGQNKKENQNFISKNQSLKTRIGQLKASDLIRQQELIKQSQKTDKIKGNIKYLTDQITDQENRSEEII